MAQVNQDILSIIKTDKKTKVYAHKGDPILIIREAGHVLLVENMKTKEKFSITRDQYHDS